MANRYSQPAQAQFINTYVPLQTDELFNIGSAMASRADAAKKDLADYVDKYSRFKSPSQKDTDSYYNMTMGSIKPIVEQMVTNPDLIKTPEGRSIISGAINSIDYASLSNLEQSRDAMLQRQEIDKNLSIQGKYNPFWHGVDYTNYNSLNSGIFSDLNVTPYESIKDGSDKYFNNLKDSVLKKSNNAWIWKGVDEGMLKEVAQTNVNAYAQSRVGQLHMKEAIASGLTTPDNAVNWLRDQMVQSNREYIREDMHANPIYMMNMQISAQRAARASSEKNPETYSKNQQIIASQNERISKIQSAYPIMVSGSFSKTIDKISKDNNLPSSVSSILKSYKTPDAMINGLQVAVSSGLIQDKDAVLLMNEYMTDRNKTLSAGIYSDPSIRDAYKTTEDGEYLRNYYRIGLNDPSGKSSNYNIVDKNNKSIGTFGKIPASRLTGSLPITSSGKIISDLTPQGLEIRDGDLTSDLYRERGMTDLFKGNVISREKKEKLQAAEKSLFSDGTGLMKYALSRMSDVYMQPTGEIITVNTDVSGGDRWNSMAYNDVLVSKKQFDNIIDSYISDNKLDISKSDVINLLSGKYTDNKTSVLEEIKGASLSKYTDGKSGESSETMYKMNMIVPLSIDYNAAADADNKYRKEHFGTTNAFKTLDYSNQYNMQNTFEQNVGGLQ